MLAPVLRPHINGDEYCQALPDLLSRRGSNVDSIEFGILGSDCDSEEVDVLASYGEPAAHSPRGCVSPNFHLGPLSEECLYREGAFYSQTPTREEELEPIELGLDLLSPDTVTGCARLLYVREGLIKPQESHSLFTALGILVIEHLIKMRYFLDGKMISVSF